MKKMAVAKGHPKIIAITRADNVKSIKLLEKLGFVFESLKINQGDKLLKYVLHLNA
jgi:RimJ/RimL family protein N-acetyltransferase